MSLSRRLALLLAASYRDLALAHDWLQLQESCEVQLAHCQGLTPTRGVPASTPTSTLPQSHGDDADVPAVAQMESSEHAQEHGEHAQNQGAHGEHGEHHEELSDVDFIVSVEAFCFVLFGVALMYLLNWEDEEIRSYTYRILGGTMSIYCAVLFNMALFEYLKLLLRPEAARFISGFEHWQDDAGFQLAELAVNVMIGQFWFLMLMITMSVATAHLQGPDRQLTLLCACNLLPHFTAFGGIVLLGHLQHTVHMYIIDYEWRILTSFVFVYMLSVWAGVASEVLHCVRLFLMRRDAIHILDAESIKSLSEEEREDAELTARGHWIHEVLECEYDAGGMCIGYMFMKCWVFAITGQSVPVGHFVHAEELRPWMPLYMLILSVISLATFLRLSHRYAATWGDSHIHSYGWWQRKFASDICTFSHLHSWCLLRCGSFICSAMWPHLHVIRVANAMCMSVFCIGVILLLIQFAKHKFKERTARLIIDSQILAVALAWHEAFDEADENLVHYKVKDQQGALEYLILSTAMIIFVLPGWRWYILPRCMPAHHSDDHPKHLARISTMGGTSLVVRPFQQFDRFTVIDDDSFTSRATQITRRATEIEMTGLAEPPQLDSADQAAGGTASRQRWTTALGDSEDESPGRPLSPRGTLVPPPPPEGAARPPSRSKLPGAERRTRLETWATRSSRLSTREFASTVSRESRLPDITGHARRTSRVSMIGFRTSFVE